MTSLRREIYKGGAYLGGREVLGIAVRSVGLLVTVRLLGPSEYGAYAGALAVVMALMFLAQAGVDTYLNRRPEPFDDALFDRASTFLLCSSTVVAGLGLAATVPAHGLLEAGMSVAVLQVLLLTLPVNVLWAPAQARLDKQFRFKAIAWLELAGDVVLHVTSVVLVVAGLGLWGPVVGYVAWQLWLLVGSHVLVGRLPRWRWDLERMRAMAGFGVPYSTAQWLRMSEAVVNPLVVGPIAGTAGVGAIALCLRILETFNFVIRAGARLAVLAFAATKSDLRRVRAGLEEAVLVQVVGVGALLVVVGAVLHLALAVVLGAEWTPVGRIFPFLALAFLGMAAFSAQTTYLLVAGDVRRVVAVGAAKLALLAIGTALLVPALGLEGFGVAYSASLVAFGLTFHAVRAATGVRLGSVLPWGVSFGALLFAPVVAPALVPLTAAPLVLTLSRRRWRRPLFTVVGRLRSARAAPAG